jgi:N-acetylglucosamine-6-sulfatase
VPPGWDEWDSPVDNRAYGEYNYRLNENGKVRAYGNQPDDYLTDVLARKATTFIRQSLDDRTPFFLYLATYAPHQPATPAPREPVSGRPGPADRLVRRSGRQHETEVHPEPAAISPAADRAHRRALSEAAAITPGR